MFAHARVTPGERRRAAPRATRSRACGMPSRDSPSVAGCDRRGRRKGRRAPMRAGSEPTSPPCPPVDRRLQAPPPSTHPSSSTSTSSTTRFFARSGRSLRSRSTSLPPAVGRPSTRRNVLALRIGSSARLRAGILVPFVVRLPRLRPGGCGCAASGRCVRGRAVSPPDAAKRRAWPHALRSSSAEATTLRRRCA